MTGGGEKLIDTLIYDGLTDAFNNYHMGVTAENIAEKFQISRKEQDDFALRSQQKTQFAKFLPYRNITLPRFKSKSENLGSLSRKQIET